jgi:hypothetical protein
VRDGSIGLTFLKAGVDAPFPRAAAALLLSLGDDVLPACVRMAATIEIPADSQYLGVIVDRIDPGIGTATLPAEPASSAPETAWDAAAKILTDERRRPPRGRGRLTALARIVQPELASKGYDRQLDTIAGYLRPGLADWQRKNPKL